MEKKQMLNKLKNTIFNHHPVMIEDKNITFNNSAHYTDSNQSSCSYHYLVRFDNGHRIPYPLLNLEGIDASSMWNGDNLSKKRRDDKNRIIFNILQEDIILKAYKKKFSTIEKLLELMERIGLINGYDDKISILERWNKIESLEKRMKKLNITQKEIDSFLEQ